MLVILLTSTVSFFVVAYMLPRILLLSLRKRLIDPFDPRKVHAVTASRLGGVSFFPAILLGLWAGLIVLMQSDLAGTWTEGAEVRFFSGSLALMLLYIIGIYDDILGVAYRRKFFIQIVASLLLVSSGIYFKTLHGLFGIEEIPMLVGMVMSMCFFVFVTNAINLIDGIDGLASSLSIAALAVYGTLLYQHQCMVDAMLCFATMSALVPFCYNNIFGVKRGIRSKIFMGDTGALVIGGILGFVAVRVWNVPVDASLPHAIDPYILAYTMLVVPCFDVLRIICHRYRMRKPLFMPDRNHIHHKIIALGCTTRQALLYITLLNLCFLGINLLLSIHFPFWVILIVDVICWTGFHLVISRQAKLVLIRNEAN